MPEERPSYDELQHRLELAESALATICSEQSGRGIDGGEKRVSTKATERVVLARPEEIAHVASGECLQDGTELWTVEDRLKQLEWLLTGEQTPDEKREPQAQPYGDLTELNTSRLILDSVGQEMFSDIVRDFLQLLETSCAVYEKNGDYAFGIFSSGWCQFLDSTSFANCGCAAKEALQNDQWHCHQACWDAARQCMKDDSAVDIVCPGGIHLLAIPIRVGGNTVGAINVGYGDPPTDLAELQEIADRYQVSVDELRRLAGTYQSRPAFILANAKSRLATAARLIGAIVERQETEKKLRESEERYREIFNQMSDGVAVYEVVGDGEDFLFKDLNPAGLASPRVQLDQVIGRSVADVFPGVRDMGLFEVFQRVSRTGQAEHHPIVQYRDERISIWVENYVCRLPSGEVVAVYSDQTELRRAKADYQVLFEKMQNGFAVHEVILDEQGRPIDCRFLRVNPAFEDFIGVKAEEIVGKTVREVLPDRAQSMIGTFGRVALTGEPVSLEHYARPLGRHFEITAFRPEPGQFACLFADITDRKRAIDAIHELYGELEQRVQLRTSELQTANRDLEAFAYSVSHDLRAPLRAIHGFAEIIAQRHRASLDEEGRHFFDNIVVASHQMSRVIDDLLAYSGLGQKNVRYERVPLQDVLDRVLATYQPKILDSHAEVDAPHDLPEIVANSTLVGIILKNLVDNAITYHVPGVQPKVEIGFERDKDVVRMRIADNGIGIAPEYHEKIFHVFQRLHSESAYPGTGIGLGLVKKAVSILDGRIWVESSSGQGATFYVELPHSPQTSATADVV